jgi:hypothetical protein
MAIDFALARFWCHFNATPASNSTALEIDYLTLEIEPIETHRQQFRRTPTCSKPDTIQVAIPIRHGIKKLRYLGYRQRI